MGNVASVRNGFACLGIQTIVTDDQERLSRCPALVLPGVGAFGSAVDELKRKGLFTFIKEQKKRGIYILGICLGLQLLFEHSEEDPDHEGLGFFHGRVIRFPAGFKVPHMGWSSIFFDKSDTLFEGIPNGSYFYFAHSYYAPWSEHNQNEALAHCHYAVDFSAAIKKDNVYGLQFHPEKSGNAGLKVLENFGRKVLHGNYSSN